MKKQKSLGGDCPSSTPLPPPLDRVCIHFGWWIFFCRGSSGVGDDWSICHSVAIHEPCWRRSFNPPHFPIQALALTLWWESAHGRGASLYAIYIKEYIIILFIYYTFIMSFQVWTIINLDLLMETQSGYLSLCMGYENEIYIYKIRMCELYICNIYKCDA